MVLARPTAVLAPGAVLIGVLLLATACSGSDDAQPGTSVPAQPSIVESTPATSEPSATFATVPDEPVPGLDSDDPFCRAWSEFAGSFQALALASSVGADPANAIRLEVAAAGAVVGAVSDLDASLPAEVDDERDAFIVGLLGPFANRARMATEALIAAGLAEEQVEELGDLWLATVAGTGSQDPDLALVVPLDYQPAFDDAIAAFSANVEPISDDPSLVTDADAPQTLAYIARTCPDQGTLAGTDNIDG
ncbi:MAG TPA: hypothetical protein VES40_08405 [Ilumatobacteraceae bacterium]|nr:hypothetical protein [Ilumatobacteraceae bacterium]